MCQRVKKSKKQRRIDQFKFVRDFLLTEIHTGHGRGSQNREEDEQEIYEANHELEQILNMLRLFLHLEKFMAFSLLACLNCFLYYFTIVPARIIYSCCNKTGLRNAYKEYTMVFLISGASIILSGLDTSRVYHRIKGQSAIKLYMMFGVLEMCDKMLSSVGQSLILVVLTKNKRHSKIELGLLNFAALVYLICHAFILIYETIALNVAVNSYSNSLLTLLLSMQFAEIKASVFKRFDKEGLFQITIADIIERFQLFILLTIIAIRNLVATGRSLSTLVPNSWTLHSTSSVMIGVLCGPMITVVGSEIVVDWVKHAYITKFNRMKPKIYDRFLSILCHDHSTNLQKFQTRIGLPVPALVVLFIVLIRPTLKQNFEDSSASPIGTVIIFVLGFICLMLSKFVLQLALAKWAQALQAAENDNSQVNFEEFYVPGMLSSGMGKVDDEMRSKIHSRSSKSQPEEGIRDSKKLHLPPSLNELRSKKDSKHPHSLNQVSRYKMVSKRIW